MNCHILFPAMTIRIEMVWYIRTASIFLGVIDMFSDSVFDFSLCLSYKLFVAFFTFYAIDQVGAVASYVVFCCI